MDNEAQQNLQAVQQMLLKGEWIEEARQIPLDVLTTDEQQLIIKCINQEDFNQNEIDKLEQILGQYRGAIRKYEPEDTIQNVEDNIVLIQDEKDFLKLIDEQEIDKEITMYYPIGDKEAKLELIVSPVRDSSVITDINNNLGVFKDLTTKEKEIYAKFQDDQMLTREEQIIASRINKKIKEETSSNDTEVAKLLLSKQTRLKNNPNCTEETMYTIYDNMDIIYLASLYNKIQNILNLTNVDTDKLFRETD